MKILLIQPRSPDVRHQPVAPLGLIAIGSYLKEYGYDVMIYDRNVSTEKVKKMFHVYKPDVIGVSAITGSMLLDAIRVSKVAKSMNIPVVWGSVHPSLLPEQTLKSGVVDYVIIGEGEVTFVELLKAMNDKSKLREVDGLAFIDDCNCVINKSRSFTDISTFPPTDWSLINVEDYYQGLGDCKRIMRIYTSKGCPGQCTFCYNQAFHKRKWRGRTPEQIVDEVQFLIDKYKIDGISFIDELWSPNNKRLYDICNLFIQRNIKISWYFNARVDQYSREDLELLYSAGCRWILFGIESGSQRILKEIKKGIELKRVQEIFDMCNQIGISTIASFMFGFPDETKEDLMLTAKYALGLNATFYDFTRYMCYPGTELFDSVIQRGMFKAPDSLEGWAKISSWDRIHVNLTKVSRRELSTFNDYFAWVNIRKMLKSDQAQTLIGYIRKIIPKKHRGGQLKALRNMVNSTYEIIRILCNLLLHVRILKDYGLSLKSKVGTSNGGH